MSLSHYHPFNEPDIPHQQTILHPFNTHFHHPIIRIDFFSFMYFYLFSSSENKRRKNTEKATHIFVTRVGDEKIKKKHTKNQSQQEEIP